MKVSHLRPNTKSNIAYISEGCVEFNILTVSGDENRNSKIKQVSILINSLEIEMSKLTYPGFCYSRFSSDIILRSQSEISLRKGDVLQLDGCSLKITIAGKECHKNCPMLDSVEDCRYKKSVYFAEVLTAGIVSLNSKVKIIR